MKCNICGGELLAGDTVCKYCGNIMAVQKNDEQPTRPVAPVRPKPEPERVQQKSDAEVMRPTHTERINYCTRCGRPLDGATGKCIVCDAAAVGRRMNTGYRNTEADDMAQKKKKKKKNNTVRNFILATIALIILFAGGIKAAMWIAGSWGILPGEEQQEEQTELPVVGSTKKPQSTWEPTTDAPKKETPKPTEEPTKKPKKTPVPAEKGDAVELRGGEYEYKSHTHLITVDELDKLSRNEIKYIYWEVYARHGYTFDAYGELADYFETNHQWYMPLTTDINEVEKQFNDIEKRNIKTIFDYQKKKGWR